MNKINRPLLTLICYCLLSSVFVIAQSNPVADNPWTFISEANIVTENEQERQIIPKKYKTVQLDLDGLKNQVGSAPLRFSPTGLQSETMITLPMPDGSFQQFIVVRAPVMEPGLAAKYPMMKAYAGKGIQDPTAMLRFDITQKGFHGMILTGKSSAIFIDPYAVGNTEHYIAYYKKDFEKEGAENYTCTVEPAEVNPALDLPSTLAPVAGDCMFRTYRAAIACTGEYGQFHGGNIPDVLAAIVTSITRINSVYERDHGLTMVLVENNDQIIFLNGATDPYPAGGDLQTNQQTINANIGVNNYDIGHLYVVGSGGVAQLNSPCANNKARGLSGTNNPVGDPFDIDYVAHEMGHQFGANHTQNNACNRVNGTAMEPGSASTIMGYAGICNPNVQFNSDDHFHAISIEEIAANITTGNSSVCPVTEDTGNNAPVVDAGQNYIVPVLTPFTLTAFATDIDEDSLTYCWEQMDPQFAPMPPQSTSAIGPAFRSNSPVNSPSRTFPNLEDLLLNIDPEWEELPAVTRAMNFRVTVRDNHLGHGCTGEDDLQLNFVESAGPFLVLNPNTNITWIVGDFANINWDVANTDVFPVNCENVNILLSIDGGMTYPIILAEEVTNNGSYLVEVPDHISTTCRVKVVCADNVFFDISNQNFSIEAPTEPGIAMNVSPPVIESCAIEEPIQFTLSLNSLAGFNEEVVLNIDGLPADVDLNFNPSNIVTPPATIEITINNPQIIPAGDNPISVVATAFSVTAEENATVAITPILIESATLTSPSNNAVNIATFTFLEWEPVDFASSYYVEIANSPGFDPGTIIDSGTTTTNSYELQNLEALTVHYWRVQAINACSAGPISTFSSFQTNLLECKIFESTDTPINLPTNQPGIHTSTIELTEDVSILDLNLELQVFHTSVTDLFVLLKSPAGDKYDLIEQIGVPGTNTGCERDNLWITFDDQAGNTAEDLDNTCDNGPFAVMGEFQPITPFSTLNGQSSLGEWELEITDPFIQEGGEFTSWNMEICFEAPAPTPLSLINELWSVGTGNSENIPNSFLNASSSGLATDQIIFTIINLPVNGMLLINGVPAQIGSIFSQADIDNNLISYAHDGSNTIEDSFDFEVVNAEGAWLFGNTFNIEILMVSTRLPEQQVRFNLSPNPGNGLFTFYLYDDSSLPYQLHIFDASGKLIMEDLFSVSNGSFEKVYDLRKYPAGVYIVRIISGDTIGSRRLVVE